MASLKFYHSEAFPTTDIVAGTVYFSSNEKTIAVGTSSGTLEKYYGGKVSDVSFSNKQLTISYLDGTSPVVLDFSDTASAQGVNAIMKAHADRLSALESASGIGKDATTVSYDGANYISEATTLKAADVALDAAIKGVADKVGESTVASQISTEIGKLDATVSQAAGQDGLALSITEVDGKITAISGSIAAETYDAYGAASDVLGTDADAAGTATVYGALASAAAASSKVGTEIAKLDADVTSAEVDGMKVQVVETDGKITSVVMTSTLKSDLIGKASGDDASVAADSTIEGAKRYADDKVNALDLAQVGADGSYIKLVSQADGKVSATATAFDTVIGDTASSTNAPTSAAVKSYVEGAVADINGAMHFEGVLESLPTAAKDDAYSNGDVVLVGSKEYVRSGKSESEAGSWIELGDESMVGTAIAALDATVDNGDSQADGIKVTVAEVDGKLTSVTVTSSIKSDLVGSESDTKTADTINGAKAYADDAVSTAKSTILGTSTSTLGAAEGRLDSLETKVGTESVSAQITSAIEDLDSEKSNTAANSGEAASAQIKVTVKEVDGKLDSVTVLAPSFEAAGAAATAQSAAEGYADGLKATIDGYTVNGEKISTEGGVSLDASEINVDDTAETKETIAAALTRIEGSITNKNVSAEGDNVFISASAANNKVSVAGTYADYTAANGSAVNTTDGIVKGSVMKDYVDGMLQWVNF